MAKIKIAGSTKKAKVERAPASSDVKFTGEEPKWDTVRAEKFSDAEFDHYLRQSFRYYNYYYSVKDLKKYLVEWARTNTKAFDKATIDKFAKSSDSLLAFTPCAIAKAHKQGMPLKEKHVTYLVTSIKKVVNNLTEEVAVTETADAKPTAPKGPTIQDRLREILDTHILHFAELEDELLAGKTVDPKAHEYLTAKNVPQAMINKIALPFEKRHAEITEAKEGKCEQLAEAYAHYKAADYKRAEAFYTKLADGLAQYAQIKKATKKAAVRKPPQKEKLVAKLKYLKADTVNKLVSISPVDIIGAQTLWVYDTKTRKMFVYYAEDMGGALSVKSASITGFNATTSVGKTIRKPEVQLKEFMAAGKVALRTFVKDIKAVEVKANGRINANQILLKVA